MLRDLPDHEIRTVTWPRPRVAMVRVTHESGESFVTERELFVSHNCDSLSTPDLIAIRAGRPVRLGGGASPIVDVMPVTEVL